MSICETNRNADYSSAKKERKKYYGNAGKIGSRNRKEKSKG